MLSTRPKTSFVSSIIISFSTQKQKWFKNSQQIVKAPNISSSNLNYFNSKGINYNLTKPKEILVVYSAHTTFHQYSSKTFPNNFKLQAKNFNLLIIKRSGRRTQGKNTLSCKTKIIHNENKNLPFTFFLFIIVLLLLPRRRRTRKISNTRKKNKSKTTLTQQSHLPNQILRQLLLPQPPIVPPPPPVLQSSLIHPLTLQFHWVRVASTIAKQRQSTRILTPTKSNQYILVSKKRKCWK